MIFRPSGICCLHLLLAWLCPPGERMHASRQQLTHSSLQWSMGLCYILMPLLQQQAAKNVSLHQQLILLQSPNQSLALCSVSD